MRLGIYLCGCNKTSNIDFKKLKKEFKSEAEVLENVDRLCQKDGLLYIYEGLKKHSLDSILIGCDVKTPIFSDFVMENGLHPNFLSVMNLREECGWVHRKEDATGKASALLGLEIHEIKKEREPLILPMEMGDRIIIAGKGDKSWRMAGDLAAFSKASYLTPKMDHGMAAPDNLDLILGEIKEINGKIGNFHITYKPNPIDPLKCIKCGKCLEACESGSIGFGGGEYFTTGGCDSCGSCSDICPTKAIDLDGKLEEIVSDQVLIFSSNTTINPKRGLYVNPISIGDPLENISNSKYHKFKEVNQSNCAGEKSGIDGCDICNQACPSGAIHRNQDRHVIFEEESCTNCGSCAALCPFSIPKMLEVNLNEKIELILQSTKLEKKVILFVSDKSILKELGRLKMDYPPYLTLYLPHLNWLSELDILRLVELGGSGSVLLDPRREYDIPRAERANGIFNSFGMGKRVMLLQDIEPVKIINSLESFYKELPEINMKKSRAFESKNRRTSLNQILRSWASKFGPPEDLVISDPQGSLIYGSLNVNNKCTYCNACVNMCPSDAISRDSNRLRFKYSDCIGCQICGNACPEGAIEVRIGFDLNRIIEEDSITLSEPEMLSCLYCGKPFASSSIIGKVSSKLGSNPAFSSEEQQSLFNYCINCKPVVAFEIMEKKDTK